MAQGLAFLSRYRKLTLSRLSVDVYVGEQERGHTVEEVEYNYGRCFHGIGEL